MRPSPCPGCGRPIYWLKVAGSETETPFDLFGVVFVVDLAAGTARPTNTGEQLGVNHYRTCYHPDRLKSAAMVTYPQAPTGEKPQ